MDKIRCRINSTGEIVKERNETLWGITTNQKFHNLQIPCTAGEIISAEEKGTLLRWGWRDKHIHQHPAREEMTNGR
jgi:hypothetical protein